MGNISRVVILHFSPLELYPPVQNLINVLGEENRTTITILTTRTTVPGLKKFECKAKNIKIKRFGSSGQRTGILTRYWTYLNFYIGSLLYLWLRKPESVLYFETISSFPVYFYNRYLNKKGKIFIHYHEYVSPEEFKNGMKITSIFHKYEKWLYPKAVWVSQTNEYRMQLFLNDIGPAEITHPYVLPNYPPESWNTEHHRQFFIPIKVVYVGALSLETMYVKEFAEFVLKQNGKITWDIYSYNITENTKHYLLSLKCGWIALRTGIEYEGLPEVLKLYDVGVILYKGHIPNYIYNAPNKLFEYFACGLHVWFPEIMKGSLPYITRHTYPKIVGLDFLQLNDLQLNELIEQEGYLYESGTFNCEKILKPLVIKLISND